MATLEDLKQLAEHLSPGFRVAESEIAPVVSALIQFAEHGDPVLEAAKLGGQAVADFYHDVIAKHAAANNLPEPPKGAPVLSEPVVVAGQQPAAAPASGLTAAQVGQIVRSELAAALAQLGVHPSEPAPGETPAGETATEASTEANAAPPAETGGVFG